MSNPEMNTAGEERAKKILKAYQDAKKTKLREKILKFILLVAGIFALICSVRVDTKIKRVEQVSTLFYLLLLSVFG